MKFWKDTMHLCISFPPFHATGLSQYRLKASENLLFFDIFIGYRKRPVAWNELS